MAAALTKECLGNFLRDGRCSVRGFWCSLGRWVEDSSQMGFSSTQFAERDFSCGSKDVPGEGSRGSRAWLWQLCWNHPGGVEGKSFALCEFHPQSAGEKARAQPWHRLGEKKWGFGAFLGLFFFSVGEEGSQGNVRERHRLLEMGILR